MQDRITPVSLPFGAVGDASGFGQGWISVRCTRSFPQHTRKKDGLSRRLELDEEGQRYVGQIQTAFQGDSTIRPTPPSASSDQSGLTASLSKREHEVLAALAQRLSNKEIAGQLHISPETVKRHANAVYKKLGVHGRREVVVKATGLGILPQS